MNWLNPVNWIKAGIASAAESKVDELVTVEQGKRLAKDGLNYCIGLSESKVSDDQLRKTSEGLVLLGDTIKNAGLSISPDGDEGRRLSDAEIACITRNIEVAFGKVIDEEKMSGWRAKIKALVRNVLGI